MSLASTNPKLCTSAEIAAEHVTMHRDADRRNMFNIYVLGERVDRLHGDVAALVVADIRRRLADLLDEVRQ